MVWWWLAGGCLGSCSYPKVVGCLKSIVIMVWHMNLRTNATEHQEEHECLFHIILFMNYHKKKPTKREYFSKYFWGGSFGLWAKISRAVLSKFSCVYIWYLVYTSISIYLLLYWDFYTTYIRICVHKISRSRRNYEQECVASVDHVTNLNFCITGEKILCVYILLISFCKYIAVYPKSCPTTPIEKIGRN